MNSSLKKALAASLLAVGGTVAGLGQTSGGGFDYDSHCIDPNNTAPYSAPFITYYQSTPLWSAGLGITGTVSWKFCVPGSTSGGSVPVQGRFQFSPGYQGSIQDNLRVAAGKFDVSPDDAEDFQYGANQGFDPYDFLGFNKYEGAGFQPGGGATSGSGWSFARVYTVQGTTSTNFLFGSTAFTLAFQGSSGRYMYAEQISNSVDTKLVIDVLGDTSRFSWRLTNLSTSAMDMGLWLGQWVVPMGGYYSNVNALPDQDGPVDNYMSSTISANFNDYTDTLRFLGWINDNGELQPYVQVPGLKPLQVDTVFTRSADPSNFPAYCNFAGGIVTVGDSTTGAVQTISPQVSGGMQVVLSPYQNVEDESGNSDQTPVDEFTVGDVAFILSGDGLVTDPTFGNKTFSDADFAESCSYLEKWQPTVSVAPNGYRDIISYYRSTWGDSNYANGYTAVVDTPKAISSNKTDLTTFDPNPFTIRVNIDNTGGASLTYKNVALPNVTVTLSLPAGMHAVGNSAGSTLTSFVTNVPVKTVVPVDFQVQVDPDVFGPKIYTVTISPDIPGTTKTITGTINVATLPKLQILAGANLVASPWVYNSNPTWEQILSPQVPVADYQTYTWDSTQQAYILQTNPSRGIGTWIVSNQSKGFVDLGGTPTQPTDELPPGTGAGIVQLNPGWNLVGNPYNYSFYLGQLVGIPGNQAVLKTYTYNDLVANGFIDGSFAYYQPSSQDYQYIGAATDEMSPNYGYWVYATVPVTLSFPPVYDLFVRSPKPQVDTNQTFDHYSLQLAARGATAKDFNTYVGVDSRQTPVLRNMRKAPISPNSNAVRAFATSASFIPGITQATGVQGTSVHGLPSGSKVTGLGSEYARMIHSTTGKQVFNYTVYSAGGGPVTVSWPNINTLPRNQQVFVKDLSDGSTTTARSSAGITYYANPHTMKTFQVTINPAGDGREYVSNITTAIRNTGATKHMKIGFTCGTSGEATITLYKDGKLISNIVTNMAIAQGLNSYDWGMTLNNGSVVTPGQYKLLIQTVGEFGDKPFGFITINL